MSESLIRPTNNKQINLYIVGILCGEASVNSGFRPQGTSNTERFSKVCHHPIILSGAPNELNLIPVQNTFAFITFRNTDSHRNV